MVRRGDRRHVARQLINLHRQESYDALDLAGFVNVAALLADRVEFIEEQHAGYGARVVKEAPSTPAKDSS
jgi:hypothetical protein